MSLTLSNPNDMRREQARRVSNRDRALEALQVAGARGVLNTDLMAIAGTRAGSRVHELRDLGHVIVCDRVQDGIYRYTLRTPVRGALASLQPVACLDHRGLVQSLTPPDSNPAATGLLFDL